MTAIVNIALPLAILATVIICGAILAEALLVGVREWLDDAKNWMRGEK